MDNKILSIISCWILLLSQCQAGIWKCEYAEGEFSFESELSKMVIEGYTCGLRPYGTTTLTKITGKHDFLDSDYDVECLDISNELETFSSIVCLKFNNLRSIWIENAEIGSFDENSLDYCENLKFITLKNNKLRELPEDLLSGNSELTQIIIQNNEITSLSETFFKNQKKVQLLVLDSNKISSLPPKIFQSLTNLQELNLYSNKLQVLDAELFMNLENLRLLNLKNNQINFLPTSIFHQLVNLEYLDLDDNKLEVLDSDWFVNLGKLKNLTLSKNLIAEVSSENLFPSQNQIKFLNLEQNLIRNLPHNFFHRLMELEHLNLGNNSLKVIDPEWFKHLKKLRSLVLNENEIMEVPEKTLFPSHNQLKFLDLEQNKISFLPPKFFHQLVELEYVNLGNNSLKVIDPEWFIHLKKLKDLGLQGNQISQVSDENYFPHHNALENLRLDENQISFLPSKFLHPLVYLQYLDLFNNKLQAINPKWFENLKSLEILDLSSNEITQVYAEIFKPLESLKELYLSKNKIKSLSPDCFNGLQDLNMLTLSMNEISELPSGIFVSLKSLKELHMHNNRIAIIHSDFFGNNKNLKTIDLMNNTISAFDEKVIDNTDVRYLNMTNNLCFNDKIEYSFEIKWKLDECFKRYRLRCGTFKAANRKIISGAHITRGAFPWIAAVENKNGELLCTGTLVTNKTVVTTASCILDKNTQVPISASDIKVILGAHNLNNQTEKEKSAFEVESVHLHSEHNKADIVLLALKQEITSSYYIEPACLFNSTSKINSIDNAVVVGFNKIKKKAHKNFAKAVNISVDRTSDCLQTNSDTQNISSYQTFCGRISNGTCNIESGSGLYVHHNGVYYLRGITTEFIENRSNQCDENGNLIFTNMLMFTEWINGILLELDKNSANLNSHVYLSIYLYSIFVVLISYY